MLSKSLLQLPFEMSRAVLSLVRDVLLLVQCSQFGHNWDMGNRADEISMEAQREVSPATGVRSRVRDELTKEILSTAKRHLATEGAAALSLRAVAREVGMVSSAVYRYFPSRDDLLTALIVSAYEDLADALEVGERKAKRTDIRGRWVAAGRALRQWAIDCPHEWGLIYGTPIPGYVAPLDTVTPVLRATGVLVGILRDGLSDGAISSRYPPLSTQAKRATTQLRSTFPDVSPQHLLKGFSAWVSLIGLISFELFGHMNNVIDGPAAFFDHELERLADELLIKR